MTTRVIMWIECYVSMARPVFIPFFIYNYICTSMRYDTEIQDTFPFCPLLQTSQLAMVTMS